MRPLTFGLLGLAVLLGGDDAKKDTETIQGTWAGSGLSISGKPLPAPPKELPTRIFTGDKLLTKDPPKPDQEATFQLSADKSPKHIDMTDKKSGKTLRGIYSIEGDTLKIAYPVGGYEAPRPTAFDGDGVVTETLKRVKK
jgi:uncharacterized protein (TIGR03067 family)